MHLWKALGVGLTTLLVVVACGSPTGEPDSDNGSAMVHLTPGGQSVEILNGDPDAALLVAWAFSRFETAGLAEPQVRAVDFAPDAPRCLQHGVHGWAEVGGDDVVVGVCLGIDQLCHRVDDLVFTNQGKLCLLHELGHAWLADFTSDSAAEQFMTIVGVETWHDHTIPWEERGVELAAETMAFGLMDRDFDLIRTGMPKCSVREPGFVILTGVDPLARCSRTQP